EIVVVNAKDIPKRNALKKDGPGGQLIKWNDVDEKHFNNEVRIQTVGTYHDEDNGLKRGKNGVWLIDIDGVRIAHLGDLGHLLTKEQLKLIGKVDVLMVPAGGVYTIHGINAFKVMQQIKPRRTTIPMHYGTPIYGGVLPLSYFTDECKEENVPVTKHKG